MFKVTEILKGSQGNIAYMNYVKDGGPADVMTAVGQILNHRTDSIEDLVNCDGIIIDVNGEDEWNAGETLAVSGALASDLEVLQSAMHFVTATHEARWNEKRFSFNKLVIQF